MNQSCPHFPKTILFLCSFMLTTFCGFSQRIRGKINDESTGKIVKRATINIMGGYNYAFKFKEVEVINGTFSFKTKPGRYQLEFIATGYEKHTVNVKANNDETTSVDVTMKRTAAPIDQVSVGSRNTEEFRSYLESLSPIDIISGDRLRMFAQNDLNQALSYAVPAFHSSRQTVSDGSDHVDPSSLRGLSPDQMLILINGKRRHSSALVHVNGTFGRGSVSTDLAAIPMIAVERIEILRDGAAAQYGSDAIAGVINIILKNSYQGINAATSAGQTIENDGAVTVIEANIGLKISKDGFLNISGQYNNRGATNRSGIDNSPLVYTGITGSFPSTPTGENTVAYRQSLIASDNQLVATNGFNRQDMIYGNASARNVGLVLSGGFKLSTERNLYFVGTIGSRTGSATGNVRLPNARGQQAVNADGTLYYPNGFLPRINPNSSDFSLLGGMKGKWKTFSFDISNNLGSNFFEFNIAESNNASMVAGTSPRSFYAGGLGFIQNTTNIELSKKLSNLNGKITSANTAFGAEFRVENYKIAAGEEASYSNGNRLATPATPATTPIGTVAGAQVFPGFQPGNALSKSRANIALFADVEAEIIHSLLVEATARFENYSDFGSNLSWKLGSRMKITDNISLRGAISTGFRAPSLQQRYFNSTSTQVNNSVLQQTLTANNDNPIVQSGFQISSLKPETSLNKTIGVAAKISDKYTLTIDAYQINIDNRIVLSSAFNKSNPLVAPIFATLAATDATFQNVNSVQFFTNAVNTKSKGLDIAFTGKFNVATDTRLNISAMANFNNSQVVGDINSSPIIDSPANNPSLTNGNLNPANDFRVALFDRQQRSRIEVLQPQNKIILMADIAFGKLTLLARIVRFGESKYVHNLDPLAARPDGTMFNDINPATDQAFSPIAITDLIANYKLSKQLSVSVGANNLFNVYPDKVFIDSRNALGSIDYSAGRDASNRGRIIYRPEQFGYNGMFLFGKLLFNML